MTMTPYDGAGAVSTNFTDDDMNVGFEDIDTSDMSIPRLRIVGDRAVFVDSLSGQEYSELNAVFLGLVKQRIMWDDDVEDNEKPLCKSPDFENGFPNVDPKTPVDKQFPWSTSNFNKPTDDVQPVLHCASCVFKEWDKTKWKTPPCSEQHTYVLMYEAEPGAMVPALFTTQRSGMKGSKAYVSSFMRTKTPMFTVHTTVTLDPQRRGSVNYAVPVYKRGAPTDENSWAEYAMNYRGIRDMIRQPPRAPESNSTVSSTAVETKEYETVTAAESPRANTPKEESKPASTQMPASTPTPVADDDSDDLPF